MCCLWKFLKNFLVNWIVLQCLFSPILVVLVDGQTTEFTSSPSNVSYVLQGSDVSLQWRYTLSSSDDSNFVGVVWEIDHGGASSSNIRLYSVPKSGGGGPGTNLGDFSGHVHDAGSSYSSKLASFRLSDIQQVHTNEKFVCGLFIGTGVKKYSKAVYVKLGKLPEVSLPDSSKTCNEGQQCILRCTTSGIPAPTVSWTKKGQSTVLSNQANFVISSVQKSQSGTYKCQATNQFGYDDKEMSLVVNYKPENVKLTSTDADNTVTVGDSLTLTCSSDAQPSATFSFYHQNIKKPDTSSTLAGTLQINNVANSDHGQWSCQASNSLGSTRSSNLKLDVKVPPQLTRTPTDQTVSEGNSITFQCQASGRPTPTITWTEPSGQTKTGSTYTKNNVQRTDQGEYQCKASNGVGNGVTAKVTLTVNYVDIDTASSSPTVVESCDGHVTELKCVAAGQPTPFTFTWTGPKTRQVVNDGRVSKLTFTPTQDSHYGDYTCQVQNSVGTAQHVMRLQQIQPPSAPDIETAVFSKSSIKLTWTVPGQVIIGCGITGFTVEWRKVTEKNLWTSVKITDYSYEINNIQEDSEYVIRVSAWNAAGQGPKSIIQNVIVKTSSQDDCQTWKALFGVSLLLLLVIILFICVLIYRRYQSPCLERLSDKKSTTNETPYTDQSRPGNQNEAFYMELQPTDNANVGRQQNYESVQSNTIPSSEPAIQSDISRNYQPLSQSRTQRNEQSDTASSDPQRTTPDNYQPLRQPRSRRDQSNRVASSNTDLQSTVLANPLSDIEPRLNDPSDMVPSTTYEPLRKGVKKPKIYTKPTQNIPHVSYINPRRPKTNAQTVNTNINSQNNLQSNEDDSYEISPNQ